MRWSQGVWSEKRLIDAVNATGDFFAIAYGPSGVAPNNSIRDFELYFERLEAAGLHVYFLIQALERLSPGGRLAFVMPADTCEGKSAPILWEWISQRFCVEAVATFHENATPFPNVDTNALVFLIKNTAPEKTVRWMRVMRPDGGLRDYIKRGFPETPPPGVEVSIRELAEGIKTGLSRPPQRHSESKWRLRDFARVMRGIVTGDNGFFFLTSRRVSELGIPADFLRTAIGRTRDVSGDELTAEHILELEGRQRPVNLLYTNGHATFPASVTNYLQAGVQMGVPERVLIKMRNPWYKMETREVPPILFAYLGRRSTRFIKNTARALPLTGFLCVYPHRTDEASVNNLLATLNHPDTLKNLPLVGKSYGSGAIKVEPGNLANLPLPDSVVEWFNLSPARRGAGEQQVLSFGD